MSEASFYACWAEHYDAVFPVGPKAAFVSSIIPPPARILDLGCATGGVAVALAELGHRVHGVELEPALLARAQARRIPGASFTLGDMLALPAPEQPFDGVICLGNTLVHLIERSQRVAALEAMAARAVGTGRLVLQIVNYDRVLAQGVERLPLIETEALRFERRYRDLQPERLIFEAELSLHASGRSLTVAQPLAPLTRAQLDAELREAGWAPSSWFGAYDGRPWAPESFGCIVVADRV